MPKREREPGFGDVNWRSPCLEPFGVRTTKGYADLVRRARLLACHPCRVEAPDQKPSARMRTSVAPGKFVKDPADRLVDVEVGPADHWQKGILPSTEPPSWRDLYSLPPDVQFAVEQLLGLDDIASWRKTRIHALSALARDAASLGGNMRRGTPGLDALLKASARQLPSVKLLTEQVNIAFVAVMIDDLQYPDTLLPWLLASGMSVVGDVTAEASHVYRPDVPIEPIEEFQERWRVFERGHHDWLVANESRMLGQVRSARDKARSGGPRAGDDLDLLQRATQVEVHKGLMGPALRRDQLLAVTDRRTALSPLVLFPALGNHLLPVVRISCPRRRRRLRLLPTLRSLLPRASFRA